MKRWTKLCLRLSLLLFCAAFYSVNPSVAEETDFLDQELTPELVEQYELKLNAILKTRSDQEKLFIASLVKNVREGQVPIKLVSTSFKWVQENRPLSNYPFIYFEKVLRLQANKIGVAEFIPPFDFDEFRSSGQRTVGQQLNAGQPTEQQSLSLLEVARARVSRLFRRISSADRE